jgi:hypothetical protein
MHGQSHLNCFQAVTFFPLRCICLVSEGGLGHRRNGSSASGAAVRANMKKVDPLSSDSKRETRALVPLNAPRSTFVEVETGRSFL